MILAFAPRCKTLTEKRSEWFMLNRIQQFINKDLKLTAVRISATIQFQQCKIFEWISEDTRQAGEALLC